MRSIVRWTIVLAVMLPLGGCGGGMSQNQMKKNALRRTTSDEDEEEAAETPAATSPATDATSDPLPSATVPSTGSTPSPNRNDIVAAASNNGPSNDAGANSTSELTAPTDISPARPKAPLTPEERVRQTVANLEKIGEATQKYTAKAKCFPAHAIYDAEKYHKGASPMLSWRVTLLPYLGHQSLFDKFKLNEPWFSPHNKKLLAEIPPVYQSPDRQDDRTNYLAVQGPTAAIGLPQFGVHCAYYQGETILSELEEDGDGQAHTAIIVEVDDQLAVPWTQPSDFQYGDKPSVGIGQLRGGGFLTIWGSGLVSWIPSTTPDQQRIAMFTSRGREKFSGLSISQDPLTALNHLVSTETQPPSPATNPTVVASASSNVPSTPVSPVIAVGDVASASTGPMPVIPIAPRGLESSELAERSRQALAQGRQRDAFQLYYASVLASDSEQFQMNWYPALKRPAVALRWGVYVKCTNVDLQEKKGDDDDQVDVDPTPIQPQIAVDPASTLRDRTDEGEPAGPMPDEGLTELNRYTGELGQRVLTELKRHVDEGKSGQFHLETSSAAIVLIRGDYAAKYYPVQLANGIIVFRVHEEKYSRHLARMNDVDVLIEFIMEVKKLKNDEVRNSTTIRVLDSQHNWRLFESQPLVNLDVQEARDNPIKADPVPDVFDRLREVLDTQLAGGPLPENLKVEHVRSRVRELTGRNHDNPLPVLAEIRFYRDKGYLSQIETREAYQAILGAERGLVLATGTAGERIKILDPWLPTPHAARTN